MPGKQQLIDDLDTAYSEFRSAIEGLDERQFERKWLDGNWGVREIVAHHTGWLGQFSGGLERMARGERPSPEGVDWTDEQHWNETFAEHAKGKRQDEVLAELESALESFKAAAERVPDERFGGGRTADMMFDNAGISHFKEHAEMIREWRRREGV